MHDTDTPPTVHAMLPPDTVGAEKEYVICAKFAVRVVVAAGMTTVAVLPDEVHPAELEQPDQLEKT